MRAHLIAVGERMPAWVGEGFAEYAKRLSHDLPLQLVEISTKARSREVQRALAAQLARWRMQGQDLAFVIGGPDGLAPAVLERAQQRWSLGPATLPHPLARIVVAEQLYRAVSQLGNHPYHRG